MRDPVRTYTFGPLEKRGLVLGLSGAQLATLSTSLIFAAVSGDLTSGPARFPAVVVSLILPVALALVPVSGLALVTWLPVGAGWLVRRISDPSVSAAPLAGQGSMAGRPRLDKRLLDGISVTQLAGAPGVSEIGVIRDTRSRSLAAVVPVKGRSFSLLDPADQVQRLDSWRSVLATLARPGTSLRRVQWLERSAPEGRASAPVPSPSAGAVDPVAIDALGSYASLIESSAPATQAYDVWVVLSVGGARRGGRRDHPKDTAEVLRRELRLLDGQLRAADLRAGPPLGPADLGALIGSGYLAVDEQWSALRVDGEWHATYWVSEWPRIEVPPDFLAPLLVCGGKRAVSVVMAPVSPGRAVREARSARTADLADAELRARAGFLPSARREREADVVVRRETELADGHSEFRFSGYVTVSADDRPSLDTACAEAEHAAQSSRLELRRLYGRQAEAFTWSLPLARGLA